MGRADEASKSHIEVMSPNDIQAISKPSFSSNQHENSQSTHPSRNTGKSKHCNRCGLSHPLNNCPAYKSLCKKCQRRGHWAQKCRTKLSIEEIETGQNQNDEDNVNNISACKSKDWSIDIDIGNQVTHFLVDTGASVSLIKEKNVPKNVPIIKSRCPPKLTTYTEIWSKRKV